MKPNDLTTKNKSELQTLLEELRMKLGQLRFDRADGKLKKTSDIAHTRKAIARVLTVLHRWHD